MAPSEQLDKYPLRVSKELKERIEAAAAESLRSVNQEIVWRLIQSFKESPDVPRK